MEFRRLDKNTVLLARMRAPLDEFLRRIPANADPAGSEAARARLFSPPSHDAGESELVADWRDYVQPDLQRLFRSALEVIERDVQGLTTSEGESESSLILPVAHLESWIHGLNQARLALCARYGFGEAELDLEELSSSLAARLMPLLQERFYGDLQFLFLQELEADE